MLNSPIVAVEVATAVALLSKKLEFLIESVATVEDHSPPPPAATVLVVIG